MAIFYFSPFSFDYASAQTEIQEGLTVIEEPLGLPATDIRLIIARIIRAALGLLGIVLVVIVMYAGFLWMTAGGNEEQINKGKKMLINATIGLAIILSAYAIVSFVMKMLGVPSGGVPTGSLLGPQTQNFTGSGALGRAIKDHYPMRDQINVPRNAKIIITFQKPILVNSFTEDTNGDGIFGNCDETAGENINWKEDCDQLIMDDSHINIFKVTTAVSGEIVKESISMVTAERPMGGAVVNASYVDGQVNTIVIRPNDYLGSADDEITYLVHLGSGIKTDDPANGDPSVFNSRFLGNDYYEWQFTCDTELDLLPPKVVSVYPSNNTFAPKNTVIQISFSEPMDPVGIQGQFVSGVGYYILEGNNIFLKSNNSTIPLGNFSLVNNYQTLEFTSSLVCGQNACGGDLFCLPVCDKTEANCLTDASGVKRDNYSLVLKSAMTKTATSFEARPFTGIMDVSGNALDGNANGSVEQADNTGAVFDDWKEPDNFYWNFNLTDSLDNTSPYLLSITPGIDAERITARQPWTMTFSKRMRADSLYSIAIAEEPVQTVPLWKVPRVVYTDAGLSIVDMSHGLFLDGIRQLYFPQVTSTLVDVNYNCFYPGQGPNESLLNRVGETVSDGCQADGTNCCAVGMGAEYQAFCCNGLVDDSALGDKHTIESCIEFLTP